MRRLRCSCLAVWLPTLLLAGAPPPGLAAPVPEYQVGDTARETVVTPMPLVVVDAEDTAVLRAREAGRIQVICRYYTNAADAADAELRSAFATARSNFLDKVQARFKRRRLDAPAVASTNFAWFAASFQKQYKAFPISTNLAEAWARGQPDRVLLASWSAALRQAMASPLRPPIIPAELKFGSQVRLVPLADWDEPLTEETIAERGISFAGSNVLTFTRARDALLAGFGAEDKSVAKFLVTLMRTNCLPDAEATKQARVQRTQAIWGADHYEAGQVLVADGQVVDRKIKAALDQLREKMALARIKEQEQEALAKAREQEQQALARAKEQEQQALFQPPAAAPSAAAVPPKPAPPQHTHSWAIAGAGLACAFLLAILWRLARRPTSRALVPIKAGGDPGTILIPGAEVTPEAREQLMPHFLSFMKDKLFQKLVWQQHDMLDAQKKAAADMAELEARLEKIQAPLQDRLHAYEERIIELEKELAQKGEENRALIRMKIELMRNQLAATRDRLQLN